MAAGASPRRRFRSGREGEPVGRLDADHGGDDDLLKFEVAIAEEGLDRLGVETARDLFGCGDSEIVASDFRKAARLGLVPSGR